MRWIARMNTTVAAIAVAALVTVGCSSGSDQVRASQDVASTSSSQGPTIANAGVAPTFAASPSQVLAVGGVIRNLEGDPQIENEAVLISPDGRIERVASIPSTAPLRDVAATSLGTDRFVVVGSPCGQVRAEDDADCADDGGTTSAFVLDSGSWKEIAAPPTSIQTGVKGLGGSDDLARFASGSGTILTYEPTSDEWSETPSSLATVEQTCATAAGPVAVGRLRPGQATGSSNDGGMSDVALVRLDGAEMSETTPIPKTGTSVDIVCASDASSIVVLSATGVGPSYVIDANSFAAEELPELPRLTAENALLTLTQPTTSSGDAITVTMATTPAQQNPGNNLDPGELVTYQWSRETSSFWKEVERRPASAPQSYTSSIATPLGVVYSVAVETDGEGFDLYTFEVVPS